ncbi:hypothetical protein N9L47_10960 [Rhodobacteraceae bacterium]|nr:hypothetical protein [Paracoccaceae bacterium]
MARYVLFKRGETPTEKELTEIVGNPGVTVLENDLHRLFLIETSSETISEIEATLSGWTIGIEKYHKPPGRPRDSIIRSDESESPDD